MKQYIKVHNQFEAIHCWEKCPHKEVAFLKYPHRHIFHVYVTVEVGHNDREVEFFILQKYVEKVWKKLYGSFLKEGRYELGSRSCEMINQELYLEMAAEFDSFIKSVETSEDNENSAILEFDNIFGNKEGRT